MQSDRHSVTKFSAMPVPEETFRDYLFELIKLVEGPTPDRSEIKALAEKAADLDHVPEIDVVAAVSYIEKSFFSFFLFGFLW